MTNFIPIFPLGIVVYPGEELNLHIFEPRYKQLVDEYAAAKKPFASEGCDYPTLQGGGSKEGGPSAVVRRCGKRPTEPLVSQLYASIWRVGQL